MNYNHYREEALNYEEKNDCAVRAVSVATGVAYVDVRAKMAEFGRAPRSGTRRRTTFETATAFGFKCVKVKKFLGSTVRAVERHLQGVPHPPLLVFVSEHVLAVKNGAAVDWASTRLHRVLSIYAVLPLEADEGPIDTLPAAEKCRLVAPVKPGTTTATLWQLADAIEEDGYWSRDSKGFRDEYLARVSEAGINSGTALTQLNKWRRFKQQSRKLVIR